MVMDTRSWKHPRGAGPGCTAEEVRRAGGKQATPWKGPYGSGCFKMLRKKLLRVLPLSQFVEKLPVLLLHIQQSGYRSHRAPEPGMCCNSKEPAASGLTLSVGLVDNAVQQRVQKKWFHLLPVNREQRNALAPGSTACFGKRTQERLQHGPSSLSRYLSPGKEEFGRGSDWVINTILSNNWSKGHPG